MSTVNGGLIIRVLPRTPLNFGAVKASSILALSLVQHIDVSGFQEVDMIVRYHSGTIGAGASLLLAMYADGYSYDDPATNFGFPGGSVPTSASPGTVNLTNSTTAPYDQLAQFGAAGSTAASPFGRFLSIGVVATQPAALQTLSVAISIDLALKGGDPAMLGMTVNAFRGYRVQ